MNLNDFSRRFSQKIEEINKLAREETYTIVANEAVDHFKKSFADEGFTDETLQKWPDVERRNPQSPWYGFQPGNKNNFSPARAVANILTGTGELGNAITSEIKPGVVTIKNDKEYAAVHNYGGEAKIFGKKSFQMKKRQFIGPSRQLLSKINKEISNRLKEILQK